MTPRWERLSGVEICPHPGVAGLCRLDPYRVVDEMTVVNSEHGENIRFLLQVQRLVVPRPASVGSMSHNEDQTRIDIIEQQT